jgi:Glycosyltransferase 61
MSDTSTPPTVCFDVTDLLGYLRVHETVSGVERAHCELLRSVAEVSGAESIQFVVLDDTRALGTVETAALLDVIELVRSGSAPRGELDHALTALFARIVPRFVRPHDLFLLAGAFWSVDGMARLLRELKNAGVSVGIFVHHSLSVTDPRCGDVHEARRVLQAVAEGLVLADFIVTTSDESKASLVGYMAARQLPPLPVDVVPPPHERPCSRPWRAVAEEVLDSACTLARRVAPFDGMATITLPANQYLPITSDARGDGGLSANLACISGWRWPEPWGVWADEQTAMLGFRTTLAVGTRIALVLHLIGPGSDGRAVRIVTGSGTELETELAGGTVSVAVVSGFVEPGQVVSARIEAETAYGGLYCGLKGILHFQIPAPAGQAPEPRTETRGSQPQPDSPLPAAGRIQLRSADEARRAVSFGAFLRSSDAHWPMRVDDYRSAPLFTDHTDRQAFLRQHADKVGAVTDGIALVRRSDQYVSMARESEGSAFDRSGVTRAFGYLPMSLPWLSPDVESVWVDEAHLERAPRLEKSYLVFFNGNMQNYYHWMAEGLLSLHILSQALGPDPTLHIALPKPLLDSAALDYRGSIRAVGLDHYPIEEVDADLMRVQEGIWVESDLVRSMPARCLRDFQRSAAVRYAGVRGPRNKRLLVKRRRPARAIHNLPDVEKFLAHYDFETVYLEGMSVADQIVLFQQAEFVISPHGAALTNLLFCEPGTKVIEFMPSADIRPHFWLISEKLNLVHGMQCCGTAGAPGFDASVVVDIGKLQALYRIVDAHGD